LFGEKVISPRIISYLSVYAWHGQTGTVRPGEVRE
jgi:hypothetical protein